MILAVLIVILCTALFVVALLRPWPSLVALLLLLPFNGLLVDVLGTQLALPAPADTLLGAWHDALSLGIIAASLVAWVRSPGRRGPTAVEVGAALFLASGIVSVVIAPHPLTATYAFRNIYEPVAVIAAIFAIARRSGLPTWVHNRAALAIVVPAVAASLFAGWQVYVGGYPYIYAYYRLADGQVPTAYLAAFITQTRAIGTFHSPNEFGAFLVIAIGLLITPRAVPLSGVTRTWLFVPLSLALLLTFSRSAWVGLAICTVVVAMSNLGWRSVWRRPWPRARASVAPYAAPLATLVLATGVVIGSSGAAKWATATITGGDPSAASRIESVGDVVADLFPTASPGVSPTAAPSRPADSSSPASAVGPGPFGRGLGTAGPLATRFGEAAPEGSFHSEMWYANFVIQAGTVGAAILAFFLLAVGLRLVRIRRLPWSSAALGIGAGLAIGAVVIPIIDAPAVAIPLAAVVGLGLASKAEAKPDAS